MCRDCFRSDSVQNEAFDVETSRTIRTTDDMSGMVDSTKFAFSVRQVSCIVVPRARFGSWIVVGCQGPLNMAVGSEGFSSFILVYHGVGSNRLSVGHDVRM